MDAHEAMHMKLERALSVVATLAAAVAALATIAVATFEARPMQQQPHASTQHPHATTQHRSLTVAERQIVAVDEPVSRGEPVDSRPPASRPADTRKAALEALQALADSPSYAAESALSNFALADTDVAVREEAVHLLSQRSGPVTMRTLEQALHDPHPRVREEAIHAFVVLGGSEAVTVLGSALLVADASMQTRIIDALGEIGGPQAAGYLEAMFDSENPVAREAAREWLAELL